MSRMVLDDFLDWVRPFTAQCCACYQHAADSAGDHAWVFCRNPSCMRVRGAHTLPCSCRQMTRG